MKTSSLSLLLAASASTLALIAACGGTVDAPGSAVDAGADVDMSFDTGPLPDTSAPPDTGFDAGPFMEAKHPAPPQIQSYGGPVMAKPNVVPVFFSGDDAMQMKVEAFLADVAGSAYWTEATSEYGVGALSVSKSIVSTDTPPTTGDAVDTWLASMLDGTHPEWPAPTNDTIYDIYLPDNVVINVNPWGPSCKSFGGYHYQTNLKSGQAVIYAIIPRCKTFGPFTGADVITNTTSHELIEAATDPQDLTNPAYAIPDADHYVWALMPLSEVGDMCAYEPQSYAQILGTHYVQRTWSNKAAAAGHDPCVPALTAPYFNSVPVLTDNVTIDFGGMGGQAQTQGVQIPVGKSKTIEVDLFSDAPTGSWTVQAEDANALNGGSPDLTFSWDKQTGNNGDKLMLTITRVKNGPYNGSEFLIWSEKSQTNANLWFGFVSN